MECGFNEGTLQVNYLGELKARYGAAIIGAVREPAQAQERDLGFDAAIKIRLGADVVPVFFQFKQHELLVRPIDRECWQHYGGAYYRFHLRKDRTAETDTGLPLYRQHNLLVLLRRGGHLAFYVSAAFHGSAELDHLVDSQQLVENAFCADPAGIGTIFDRDEHHVSYSTNCTRWAFHSEFRPMGRPQSWMESAISAEARPINVDALDQLAHELRDLVESQYAREADRGDDESATPMVPEDLSEKVTWVAETLDAHFGAALALLPRSPWGIPTPAPWQRLDWRRRLF